MLPVEQSSEAHFRTKFTVCAASDPENMAPDMMGPCLMEHASCCVPGHLKGSNTVPAHPGRLAAACLPVSQVTHGSKRWAGCCMLTSRATFTRGQNITAGGHSWIPHFSVSVAQSHVAGKGAAGVQHEE